MTGPRSRYNDYYRYGEWPVWNATTGHKWPSGTHSSGAVVQGTKGKDELLITSGHDYRSLGKSRHDEGGGFLTIKREFWDASIAPRHYSTSSDPMAPNLYHYYGPFRAAGTPTTHADFPSPIFISDSEMDVFGTTAIANVAPTNPVSGAFVALGEAKRDGVPSLLGLESWKNRTRIARGAGSEYLNTQFGWIPLINDMKKFTYAVRNHDGLAKQYERNSGRRVKRSFKIPIARTANQQDLSAYPQPALTSLFGNTVDMQKYRVEFSTSKEIWFEGAFTYYLPPYKPNGDNTVRNEQLANYLYGTRPTPEGVWNLTPWSWAADWVVNAGDFLKNVSLFSTDGLVLSYGYVMAKTVNRRYVYHNRFTPKSYPGEVDGPAYIAQTTVKARRKATPYGFGLNPSSFSNRQWAILVALGLSRGNNQM